MHLKFKFFITGLLVTWFTGLPLFAALKITVLDVGYGTAVHVQDEFRNYLFDVGPPETHTHLMDYLSRNFVTRLDGIFLSHTHPDHAGNLLKILEQLEVATVFWNDRYPPDEDIVSMLDQAQDRSTFRVLEPGEELRLSKKCRVRVLDSTYETQDLNNDSLVYGLSYKRQRILLPGDIKIERQKNLVELEEDWLKKTTWMLWPHHGDELEQSFKNVFEKPIFCTVSVGKNEYGLPAPTLSQQSKEICKSLMLTNEAGSLTYIVNYKIHLANSSSR